MLKMQIQRGRASHLLASVNLCDTLTLLWATYLFTRSMCSRLPPAMPWYHLVYGSGARGAGWATLNFPDGDEGGKGGGWWVCEEGHDSKRGWVIYSCPFITFIKVWGADTCSLSDLSRQSWQGWGSQLHPVLQSDSVFHSCRTIDDVCRDQLCFIPLLNHWPM